MPESKDEFSLIVEETTNPNDTLKNKAVQEKREEEKKAAQEKKASESPSYPRQLRYWLIESHTGFLDRTYGIDINYNGTKNIQYLLTVKCEKWVQKDFYYTLNRKRFFKDGIQLDDMMEEMVEETVSCLYPLKIKVSHKGEMIGVENQEEIEERWLKSKKEIEKRYTGEAFYTISERITQAVSSPETLLRSLENDVVYDILFSNIYMNYTKKFTQTVVKKFKWFQGLDKVAFEGTQSVVPLIEKNERLYINYEGKMYANGNLSNGTTKIKYQLDEKRNTLLRVDGVFAYTLGETSKQVTFKAVWQEDKDKTQERAEEFLREEGRYSEIPNYPVPKWYEFWK